MEAGPNLLLVEGTSDYGVITQLWARHHPGHAPFVVDARFGLSNLREAFTGLLLGSGIERLGVVVDADEAVETRWPGFYQSLVERGYRPVPKVLPSTGLVMHRPDKNVPIVGVWVMPNNETSGRLEDFVSFMVPEGIGFGSMLVRQSTRSPTSSGGSSRLTARRPTYTRGLHGRKNRGFGSGALSSDACSTLKVRRHPHSLDGCSVCS